MKSNRWWCLALTLSCCVSNGCPGPKPPEPKGPPATQAASTISPVERIIPADPAYAVVARNLTRLVEAVRAGLGPWRVVDRHLTLDRIDRELRRDGGASLLNLNDIDDAGFDLEGPVVLYSAGFMPTFAARVKDDKRLAKFLKARTEKITTFVKSYRGQTLTSWRISSRERGTYLRIDDLFVVHIAARPLTRPASQPARGARLAKTGPAHRWDLGWLDRILERRAGAASFAGSPALSWLRSVVREADGVVAYLRPSAFNRVRREALGLQGSCAGFDTDLAQIERLGAGLRLGGRKVGGRLSVGLGPQALAALKTATALAPRLPGKVWDEAAARLRLALAPTYIKQRVERQDGRACGPLAELARDARYLLRPFYRSSWIAQASGRLAGVLLSADERGQSTLHLQGALVAAARSAAARSFFRGQLVLKPPRGKPVKVRGRAVEQVIPGLTIAEAVQASFADGLFRLSAGDSMMERLLSGADAPPAGGEAVLLEARLRPGRIADLRAPLKLFEAGPAKGIGSSWRKRRRSRRGYDALDKAAHLASSYELLELRLTLAPDKGELEGFAAYELR